ncbi:hypothetical protein EW026_g2491 [Hermanssonia centrifuga]|uniref:Insulin-degrading enzyme n=1 Tax=Hermanssonia centrifuga TaxID=98765 RepID=A0A4S4KN46_9APHY|nr:hypothetical protein EW026_g2491 [Hermanssonia centrifuga]
MTIVQPDKEWQHVSKPDIPAYDIFAKAIQKSQQDDREYRVIRLANGLEATLVHDGKADKAAASLDVAVGHLYDPDDMPGLAHFCEHLLFMGTELYPKENEYSEYLAKNNGSSNAYTGTSNTNYFFSASTNALPGALSRFAAFFHCPLFSPSCTTRELNAVNSEHKKNHQADMWRIFQLNKHLSKSGHPWSKFGSGNIDSLSKAAKELKKKGLLSNGSDVQSADSSVSATPISSRATSPTSSTWSAAEKEGDGGAVGREIRRRLVEWWTKEYSANRMRLCVIGKEPLDELSDMVSKLFSPISKRDVEALPMINDHPFGTKEAGTFISAEMIMSIHCLEVSFPIAYQAPLWRYQPGNFVAHFVGHEGPGSLHSYLKNKGWVTELSSGPQPLARGFAMFKVTMHLTNEGFSHYREVLIAVFKYLSLLRSSEFPAWYQREISEIKATRFRFQEKRRPEDYAVWLAQPWDESSEQTEGEREVREVLEGLQVRKGRAVLMAKKEEHERLRGKLDWQQEPVYGTPYLVEKFDEDLIVEAEGTNNIKELFLPGPNEFIPTNLDVDRRNVDEPAQRPNLIRETAISSLWHKKDDRFWVPRANVLMDLRSPVAYESAKAAAMTRLFVDLVTHSLTEFSYDAELAGLSYTINSHNPGIFINLQGFNDKLHVLARDIFTKARTIVVNPNDLHVLTRNWQNFFLEQPYRISEYYARYILTEKQWSLAEKLAELPSITAEELQAHIARFLSQLDIKALVVGNMYKDEAIRLIESTEQALQASPSPVRVNEIARLPVPGTDAIWSSKVPNPNEPNSVLSYYVHMGSLLVPRLRVTAALLNQILSEPAFNILRTREQLGYVVSCSFWKAPGEAEGGIRLVVQSERAPVYLEERVDAFLDEMEQSIRTMSDSAFEEQKKGLEKSWTEDPKNIRDETYRFWSHIDSGDLDFYRRQENTQVLSGVTKDEILSLFKTHIHYSSPTRAKFSVHLRSQKPQPKKVSEAAMIAFEENISQRGLAIGSQQWRQELFESGEPLLTQAITYWTQIFSAESSGVSQDTVKDLLLGLSQLAERYPAQSAYEGKTRDSAMPIDDPATFRTSLRISDLPKPVVDWGDLPTSKL